MAPMAQGMLGKVVDETATIPTPNGNAQVRIKAIERII